jgi:plasmid stability protein
MAQVLVRNLDQATVAALKARAQAHGRALEQELRIILTAAARPTRAEALVRAAKLRAKMKPIEDFDVVEIIRRDRDQNHGR